MNKKGFIGDHMLYLIMLFVIALMMVPIWYMVSSYNTAWQNADNIPDGSKNIMSNFSSRFVSVWDGWYLLLVVGYGLVTILIGFALRAHPAFAMFSVIFLIIMGIVAVHFSNAFYDVSQDVVLTSYASEFTFMSLLATRLPHIVVALGIVFIIILYAKTRSVGVNL